LVTHLPSVTTILLAMYLVMADERGIQWEKLAGTTQNDFLMETTVGSAPEIMPPQNSFRLQCDVIEFVTGRLPRWNPISYNGYNLREAGTNAVQEVAVALANAIHTVEELQRRGLDVDSFAPRLSFFWDLCNDFFEEIAKCRASRRVWYKIMKERFRAKNQRSMWMRFHVQTSGVSLTAQQPLNNIARAGYQALSAVLGGAQSVHVDAYDEALCTPTELSSLTALRTQQILQHETRVTHTIDPLGGSYFVESLTSQLEDKIFTLLEKIDQMGGIVKAVETGWIHKEISDSAYEYQQAIESGRMPIVGVNCHQTENEKLPIELFEVPETLTIQEEKLKRIKGERNASRVKRALDAVTRCCDEEGNLMEVLVESVKTYVTEGEISRAIKGCYGTWNPPLF